MVPPSPSLGVMVGKRRRHVGKRHLDVLHTFWIAAGGLHAGGHRNRADIVQIIDRDGLSGEVLGAVDRAVAGYEGRAKVVADDSGRGDAGRDTDKFQSLGLSDEKRGNIAEAELQLTGKQ